MPMARTLAAYPQARGNLAVVAVVDSSQPEFAFQFESAFAALVHFGIPFRVLDLAASSVTDALVTDCRAVLIFQEHLGPRLGAGGQAAVLRAAEGGTDLVSFDADLGGYGEPWLRAAGLTGAGRDGEVLAGGTPVLGVRDNGHPITWYQDGEPRKRLKTPVPTALARPVAPDVTVLLEDGDGAPMLVARPLGRGRMVQWLASPKLWLRQYFGHTFGLDDVWLRAITWAARKPFVMKAMPPFVRLRFDDCQGLWRDGRDLAFVDALNGRGHVPSLAFCLRAVTADGAARINALYKSGRAELAPHTLAPNTSLFWGDQEPLGALDKKLREQMQVEIKNLQRRLDVTVIYVTHDQEEALVMSDRVAVLRAGRLEQLGTPEDLYESPANRFVADFIGKANLLDGSLDSSGADDAVVRTSGGVKIRVEPPVMAAPGAAVTVVLRPERISLAHEIGACANRFEGLVEQVLYVGDAWHLRIRLSDLDVLTAKLANRGRKPDVRPGQRVVVGWRPEDARVVTG